MPGFRLVQGYTEARLQRGLDAREVAELQAFVLDGRGTPNEVQSEQLLRVSALYAEYFTPAAKKAWQKLTGIDVDKAEVTWKKSAKLYANVLDARLDLAAEKKRIRQDHSLVAHAGKLEVASRLIADEVAARTAAAPKPAALSHAEALALKLPPPLLLAGLQHGRVVDELARDLTALEKAVGDGDGVLAPRDLKGAPAIVLAIAEAVWQQTGKRALSIAKELRPALAQAVHDVVLGGSRQQNRLHGETAALFVRVANDGLDHLAGAMQADAVRGDVPYTLVLERHGINAPAHKGDLLRALEAMIPPPTLAEIARLYARACAGQLQAGDFYAITRLSKEDLFQLQATFPAELPRAPGQKHETALPAPRVLSATATSTTLKNVDDIATAWAAEVATGQRSVEEFARTHALRTNVLTRIRQKDPSRFPDPPRNASPADRRLAEALAAAIVRAAAADPFAKVPELIDAINKGERALVKEFGAISYGRYYDVRKKNPELFGRVDDSSRWQAPVAARVRELMKAEPSLSRNELVARLKKTWPAMTYSRLAHLKEADPALPIAGSYNRKSAADIDAMATRILELLRKDATLSHSDIAKVLTRERKEEVTRAYVSSIVRDFRPHLFAGVGNVDERRMLPRRTGLVAQGLLQLAIRTAPPGAPTENILAVLNQLLEERGVGKLADGYLPRLTELAEKQGLPGPSQVHARTTAAIVAEYAAAAPRGATEEQILAAVQQDWPTLDGRSLGRFRGLWRTAPRDFPELEPFRKGREVALVGLGKPITPARYLGGHDPARQLAAASPAEQLEMARFTELASIPLRLPEIDAVVDDLQGGTPLKQANVLWVSHLLADVVPMGFALKDAGAESSRTIVVGTPYGTNPSVKACLQDQGFSVRQPKLDIEDYRRTVTKAIDDAIALHKKNGEPIVVLDDGGLVSHILHADPKYASVRKKFRIVEQTTGGVQLAEKHALESVVVNVARSKSKELEGEAIGEVVAAKTVQALARFGAGLDKKDLVLIGYGVIGPAIAQEMLARGAKVTVVERSRERAALAKKAGFHVILDDPADPKSQERRRAALAKADLVVGATGRCTLSLDDMKVLKDGAAIASASSKRGELDMEGLEREASKREPVPSDEPLVTLPTARYRLKGRTITVIGDGYPVNFDGGAQSVPPEKIQITDAAMLSALFQASRVGNTQRGLIDLDPSTDARLLDRHRAEQRAHGHSKLAVYDPTRWRDVVRDVAARHAALAASGG
ncbi:MAG: NAD-binding protein [Deltaproteobacteria bacterium]|nr:NAD-binding protein [Deltaproteobacteria bacterium]